MNEGEKKVVARMVTIYCRSAHDAKEPPCEECKVVLDYALQRLERCPFGEEKPTCALCPIHCYKHDMRMKIKEVMRTAGPCMLFLHPIDTLKHFHKEHQRNRKFSKKQINPKN